MPPTPEEQPASFGAFGGGSGGFSYGGGPGSELPQRQGSMTGRTGEPAAAAAAAFQHILQQMPAAASGGVALDCG